MRMKRTSKRKRRRTKPPHGSISHLSHEVLLYYEYKWRTDPKTHGKDRLIFVLSGCDGSECLCEFYILHEDQIIPVFKGGISLQLGSG